MKDNVFTEEIDKITLSSNNDQIMQSIGLIEIYAFGTSKDLVSEKEEIKCNNMINQYKKWLIYTRNVIQENIKEHNPIWPQIPHHPYRVLITGASASGKANLLFNLILSATRNW